MSVKRKTGIILSSVVGIVAVGLVLALLIIPQFAQKEQMPPGLQTVGADLYCYDEDGAYITGFQTIDGDLYYFDPETGKAVTGWFTADDGTTYYFGPDGRAFIGKHTIDGEAYTFDEKGRLVLNEDGGYVWRQEDGKTYCIAPDGEYVTGLEKISGGWYYFDENGVRQSGWHTIDGKRYYFDGESGRAPRGWKTIEGETYYFTNEGYALTGEQTIDGQARTFDSEGRLVRPASGGQRRQGGTAQPLQTAPPSVTTTPDPTPAPPPAEVNDDSYNWKVDDGGTYYENNNGNRLKGLQSIGGHLYYFDSNGKMVTGWQTISGRLYLFGADGRAQTGWAEKDGAQYYLCKDGYAVRGLQSIGALKYYFDTNGIRQNGLFTINGRTYCFTGENDAAITGWYPREPVAMASFSVMASAAADDGETYYYFGDEYYAITGAHKIGNYWFGFDEETGGQIHGWKRFGTKLYYFNEKGGAALTDTWKQHGDGTAYLGGDGAALTGVQTIGKEIYAFSDLGFRQSGWVKHGGVWYAFLGTDNAALTAQWKERDGGWAYLNDKGAAVTGPQTVPIREGGENALYLFDGEGVALTGWQKDAEGRLYFLAEDGRAQFGEQKNGDDVYYMGEGGYALTGVQTIGDKLFYFNDRGVRQAGVQSHRGYIYGFLAEDASAVRGWHTVGARTYYFGDDYTARTGISFVEDGWYCFSANGARQTGWQTDNAGRLYYFNENTGKAHTGWLVDVNKKAQYYFTEDGWALADTTRDIDGVAYTFDAAGKLVPGAQKDGDWVQRGGNTYYLYQTGEYATGVVMIDQQLYGFTATGERISGWHEADGKHYYFGGENGEAVGGWLELEGKYYYFGADGTALTGLCEIEEQDGAFIYYLADDGARVEGEKELDGRHYFFDGANGGRAHKGWRPEAGAEGARYYGEEGFALTGVQPIGSDESGYSTYWFDDTGRQKTGWLTGGSIYAFLGEGGAALTGAQEVDGKHYLFDGTGVATVGLYRDEAGLSYYDKNGVRQSGWVDHGAHRYWFDGNGIAPAGLTGVDGHDYYFGDEGYILTDTTINTEDGWTYEIDKDGRVLIARATESHKWREVDGHVYYMDSTGDVWTGLQTIDGALYYLLEEGDEVLGMLRGARWTGWRDLDGARYLFNSEGRAHTGWYVDGETGLAYFLNSDYTMARGVVTIEQVDYEFDREDGHLLEGYEVPRFNEWDEDADGPYYIDGSGKRATGLVTIEDGLHYFGENGTLQTGFVTLESGRYYFNPAERGRAATGWAQVDGVWYSFHPTTAVQQLDWQYRADENGVSRAHYFYADGTTPGGFETVNGVKRYFHADGAMATDWQELDGARYYFYPDSGKMATGVSKIGDGWFSFDAEGRQYVGFNTDMEGRRYYFSAEGMYTGWRQVDGVWYHFSDVGAQQFGWQERTVTDSEDGDENGRKYTYYYDGAGNVPGAGWQVVSGLTRYFFEDGHMAQGFEVVDGALYYFYQNGSRPAGPATVEGVYYPFSGQGTLQTGPYTNGADHYYYTNEGALRGWHAVDGKWFHFGGDGKQQLGWQERTGDDGKTYKHYYYADGNAATGWNNDIDGVKRYFFEDGAMAVGWQHVDGADRYFFADGRMAGGVVVIDGQLRAFDDEGNPVTGWCYDSAGSRYYFNETGALRGWQPVEGRWYHFDTETAAQRTGWQNRGENGANLQYYYHADGTLPRAGWTTEIDGVDRYILPDGQAAQGWTDVNGARFLFDDRGEQYRGWAEYEGRWYYLDETTGAQRTSWVDRTVDGAAVKYFYHADGRLPAAGWTTEIDGVNRYVLAGGQLASGWQKVGSYTYYFNNDGTYLTGEHTIDGKICRFDSTGYYIVAPVVNSVTHKAAGGSTHSVTVSATASDALQNKALSYSFDGGKTWQSSAGKDFAAGTTLAKDTIQVRDAVGNVTSYGEALTLGTAADYRAFGIDVSAWQGQIDWAKVKASGVEFAIIRGLTHNGTNYIIDPYFDYNVRQAKANGIKVGAYLYCYAYNVWGIENEVDIFYNSSQVKGLMNDGILFDLPVYIDYEDPYVLKHTANLTKTERTQIARRGLEKITERSGGKHTPGIYSYRSFLQNSIDGMTLQNEGYEVWLAEVNTSYQWPTKVPMWQYSWKGRINGINGDVDLDYCYKDYSQYINGSGSGSGGGTTNPVHNLTVTDQYGTKVTASAESILAQIVEAEMGGFRSTLTAAQAEEVFKAQAVAAQTWILYSNSTGVAAPKVALKTPSAQVQSAVAKVVGQKMTYNGGQVCSTYFANCGSYNGQIMTNNSAYWGSNHGYLSSVPSTEGQALASYSGSITNANLRARLIAIYGYDVTAGRDPSTWIKITGRNAAGYVTGVDVCGRTPKIDYFYQTIIRGATTSGSKINSPAFQFSYSNGSWNYSYTGAGHAIGMSQWGAYEMAKAGSSYDAILRHYYTGVTIANV